MRSASADGGWILSVPGGTNACRLCAGVEPVEGAHPVAGPVAGIVGSLQVREALTRLVAPTPPSAEALRIDLAATALRRDALVPRTDCAACRSR